MNKEVAKIVLSILVVIAIVGSALRFKDTEYENLWLYISCVWIIVLPLVDFFTKKKD